MSNDRLLIIEDDPAIADLVHRIATEVDFDVRAASDVNNIAELYDSFNPNVIILDILMPGMDGFEILEFLHQRASTARIVILSGQPDYRPMAGRLAEGLEITVAAIVAKPFRVAELRKLLAEIKRTLPSNGHTPKEAA